MAYKRNVVNASRSDWVNTFFGTKAFFTGKHPRKNVTSPIDDFPNRFKIPGHAKNPECSFELLGYMKFGDIKPFTPVLYRDDLIMGEGSMRIMQSDVPWTCLFRAAYDTWRVDPQFAIPMAFFCPVPAGINCSNLREMRNDNATNVVGHISIEVQNTTWTAGFSSAIHPYEHHLATTDAQEKKKMGKQALNHYRPTTCLVIPYESVEKNKKTVNGAMVYEWIRYYARMGFTVFVYDKNGANRDAIYHSEYASFRNKLGAQWFSSVFYHPYTVFGLLSNNKSSHSTYDNSYYPANPQSLLYSDDDKTATLTYCRFEANSLLGNDNVIVADFDEFLYCPGATSTLSGQRAYIQNMLHSYRQQNFGSLVMRQLWVPYKTFGGNFRTPAECLNHHIERKMPIFDCYASYRDHIGDFFLGKSTHLGHTCLLTNFHYSCNTGDCSCSSIAVSTTMVYGEPDDQCYFIHLSTNTKDFLKQNLSEATQKRFETEQSDLSMIASNPEQLIAMITHIY